MRCRSWFLSLSLLLPVALLARSDTIVVRAPATGESGPKAIIEKDSGDLVLADITKDGRYIFHETLGRLVSIPDPAIRNFVQKSRPVTNFLPAETARGTLYVITTTGLSADPDTKDSYTGKPLYVRKDDLLILSRQTGKIRQLIRRSYDAIDNVKVEHVPKETAQLVVVSTSEGQVNNSLIHIFRLASPEKVEPIRLPEPAGEGNWQESFTVSNGTGILTISLSELGSFPGHPNTAKKSVRTFRWDPTTRSFVPLSTKISYE